MHTLYFKKNKDGKLHDSFAVGNNMEIKPLSEKKCLEFINKPNVKLYGKNVEGSLVYGI